MRDEEERQRLDLTLTAIGLFEHLNSYERIVAACAAANGCLLNTTNIAEWKRRARALSIHVPDFVCPATLPYPTLLDVKGHARGDNYVAGKCVESYVRVADGALGQRFAVSFVFVHPIAFAQGRFDCFSFEGRNYAISNIDAVRYAEHMKQRSRKWMTFSLSKAAFAELSRPLLELFSC